jgi:hypothetical protein
MVLDIPKKITFGGEITFVTFLGEEQLFSSRRFYLPASGLGAVGRRFHSGRWRKHSVTVAVGV